eukprot:4517709-Amphidinium_carterae.2
MPYDQSSSDQYSSTYGKGSSAYENASAYVGSGNAPPIWPCSKGWLKTRRSTSATVLVHGFHLIRSVSTTQSVIATSSGEAEL